MPRQIALLRKLVDAGHKLVEDPVGFRVMDAEFHGPISAAADNAFLEKVASSLYGLAIEHRRQASAKPGVLKRSAEDHAAIVRAIEARDPPAASAAMAAHVENIRKSTLAVMKESPAVSARAPNSGPAIDHPIGDRSNSGSFRSRLFSSSQIRSFGVARLSLACFV